MRHSTLRNSIGQFVLAAIVGVTFGSATALAIGPQQPVKIERTSPPEAKGAALLNFAVVADPGEVAEVKATSVVESRGERLLQDEIPTQHLSAEEEEPYVRIPGTRPAIKNLEPGVYAHTVEATARIRGEDPAGKPLMVRDTRYFEISAGKLRIISSAEYTDAVERRDPGEMKQGQVASEFDGGGAGAAKH